MSTFTDQDREVIYRILDLLPTIEEAMQHMQVQLEELRIEESAALFKDTIEAIGIIVHSVLPLINSDGQRLMLKPLTNLREAIGMIIDAYEQNILTAIQAALNNHFTPSYLSWQLELIKIIRPPILS